MKNRTIWLQSLHQMRYSLLWWGVGLGALTLYVVYFYPAIGSSPEIGRLLEEAPPAIKVLIGQSNFASPEGYLSSELFFLTLPILLLIFSISLGSHSIAGEEENGTLELLLAYPVSRKRLVVEKFTVLVLATIALTAAFLIGLFVGVWWIELEISTWKLLEASAGAFLLSLCFGTLAFALGSLWGKRGPAVGITASVAVVSYFLNSLAPLVPSLEPYRKWSLFFYYAASDPLSKGLPAEHFLLFLAILAILLIAAVLGLKRRDIAV